MEAHASRYMAGQVVDGIASILRSGTLRVVSLRREFEYGRDFVPE
jgi:hypothetical protein